MYSPIKTIVKNKEMKRFAFNADGISFSIAKGEKVEINGDIFTYIRLDGDAEVLLNNIAKGLIDVSYAINSRFAVSSSMTVNMLKSTARQRKLLDKIIGVEPVKKAVKPAAKKAEEAPAKSEEDKLVSLVPVDGVDNENAKGLTTEGPVDKVPEDTAYKGMFMQAPAESTEAKADPGFGEGVVITEAQPKAINDGKVDAKIVETPINTAPEKKAAEAPATEASAKEAEKQPAKATRNKVK